MDTTPTIPDLAYQHLRAPNDPNGNPRRVYVIMRLHAGDRYGGWAHILAVLDEGYSGVQAVDGAGYGPRSGMVELPSIDVSPATYREWIKYGRTGKSAGRPSLR